MRTLRIVLITSMATMLVAPAVALGCSRIYEPPLEPHVAPSDIRLARPFVRSRAAWGVSESWRSTFTWIAREIRTPDGRVARAAIAQQRTLQLGTRWTGHGAQYTDDGDPATSCALVGQTTWSRPAFLVRETPRAIFVVAISRATRGDATGCGFVVNSCNDVVERSFRLAAPIGRRQVYVTSFGAT